MLNEGVRTELAALPLDVRAKLTHILELMVAVGPQRMREPHVKHLRDKSWEMRMSGRGGVTRAIYMLAHGRRIVLLHAFVKKSAKTPPNAIQLALDRAKDIDR